jgi:nucleotide-binding universal stress UspA family protein
MKRILVPCDFSKPSINAFRFALDVAAQSRGSVYLVNILELPFVQDIQLAVAAPYIGGWRTKIVSDLDKLVAGYNKSKIKVTTSVELGKPAHALLDFAEAQSIDLIIMGSHGASGLRELVLGSNAEKIVRHSEIPVLIIKEYTKGPIKNIVFPNTLETADQQDLTMKVKALQAFFKATVHIVFVNTPTNFISDNVTLGRLKQFAKHFMFKDYTINIHNDRYEEDGIMNFTTAIKGDLIAMGTNARKGIPHMVRGSVAENVVNHTSSPIWTYALN